MRRLSVVAVLFVALVGGLVVGKAASLPVTARSMTARTAAACASSVTLTRTDPVVLGLLGYNSVTVAVPPACVGLRFDVTVYRPSNGAVLATGGELKEPWESATGAFIRNSNAHFLLSALKAAGFPHPAYLGVVPDTPDAIRSKIREGLSSDVLVITGGVSAGEIDIVPEALAACGVEKVLHKISVKPGKPIYVGRSRGGCVVIGLPGNPVAVIVHYSMLVRPLLLKATGAKEYLPRPIWLPLAGEVVRNGGVVERRP